MAKEETSKHKPHCLILPFPIQGHINPMLQFSKRLAHKGIEITLVATKALLKTSQKEFLGSISVETISNGFDEVEGIGTVGLEAYLTRFQQVGTLSLSELLEKLKNSGRPVDCLIYDPFLPWSVLVAKKFGLFGAAFFTQSCAVNTIYYHMYKEQIKVPLLKKEVLFPGLPPLDLSDMPSFIHDPDSHPGSFELVRDQFQNVEVADFVFVNSIYELEEEVCMYIYMYSYTSTSLDQVFCVSVHDPHPTSHIQLRNKRRKNGNQSSSSFYMEHN
ncbi:hypothetical protein BUALT_Bualt10G0091100 [Buddleja alternifolia]|uniref:Glycosyltransferase N-terminal domain-containing protein n=1 Tax=Buddleja alternifolia TaxID=168488 RepID=A0AAV6WXZ5_9LAMI|nr:hypothetical protein BUALT_Bualt10G0091100 [Buddleja alternifolia]